MPITFVAERYDQYDATPLKLTQQQAEEVLKQDLMGRLKAEIGDGEIVTAQYETQIENGAVTVTLKAECLEDIAAERPFTQDELAALEWTPEVETETENE